MQSEDKLAELGEWNCDRKTTLNCNNVTAKWRWTCTVTILGRLQFYYPTIIQRHLLVNSIYRVLYCVWTVLLFHLRSVGCLIKTMNEWNEWEILSDVESWFSGSWCQCRRDYVICWGQCCWNWDETTGTLAGWGAVLFFIACVCFSLARVCRFMNYDIFTIYCILYRV